MHSIRAWLVTQCYMHSIRAWLVTQCYMQNVGLAWPALLSCWFNIPRQTARRRCIAAEIPPRTQEGRIWRRAKSNTCADKPSTTTPSNRPWLACTHVRVAGPPLSGRYGSPEGSPGLVNSAIVSFVVFWLSTVGIRSLGWGSHHGCFEKDGQSPRSRHDLVSLAGKQSAGQSSPAQPSPAPSPQLAS